MTRQTLSRPPVRGGSSLIGMPIYPPGPPCGPRERKRSQATASWTYQIGQAWPQQPGGAPWPTSPLPRPHAQVLRRRGHGRPRRPWRGRQWCLHFLVLPHLAWGGPAPGGRRPPRSPLRPSRLRPFRAPRQPRRGHLRHGPAPRPAWPSWTTGASARAHVDAHDIGGAVAQQLSRAAPRPPTVVDPDRLRELQIPGPRHRTRQQIQDGLNPLVR